MAMPLAEHNGNGNCALKQPQKGVHIGREQETASTVIHAHKRQNTTRDDCLRSKKFQHTI